LKTPNNKKNKKGKHSFHATTCQLHINNYLKLRVATPSIDFSPATELETVGVSIHNVMKLGDFVVSASMV